MNYCLNKTADHDELIKTIPSFTVKTVLRRYLRFKPGSKKSKYAANLFLSKVFMPSMSKSFKNISPTNLDSMLQRVRYDYSTSTLYLIVDILSALYNWAVENKYYPKNYLIKKRRIGRPRFFSRIQLDKVFSGLTGDMRDMSLLVYHTGLKPEEIVSIRQFNRNTGIAQLKSGKIVSIPEHIMPLVRRHYRGIAPSTYRKKFSLYIKSMDMEGGVEFLRNSYLMRMSLSGVSKKAILNQISTDKILTRKLKRVAGTKLYFPSIDFIDYF